MTKNLREIILSFTLLLGVTAVFAQNINIINGSNTFQTSGDNTYSVPLVSDAASYVAPSGGATLNFYFGGNNGNGRMRSGCCNGNSSRSIRMEVRVNGTTFWNAATPSDDNTESGDNSAVNGAYFLSGGGNWPMQSSASPSRYVSLRLPSYVSPITSIQVAFSHIYGNSPDDGGAVRIESVYMQASNATLTVNEAIAGRGRISATDQFTAQILRNGTLSNSANSSTTLGTGTQVNPGSGTTGPTTVTAGNTYTVTQVMAPPSTSALGDYTASMSCVSALGRTNLAGVSAPGASITPGTGDVVSCTITNQAACTPPSVNTTLVASLSATDARSGQARSYSVFTTDTPQAGYVQAFPLSDKGVVSNTASWDAAQLMQTQLTRTASTLYSTTSDGLVKNLQGLARDEPGVFSLAASSCVPDVNALLNVIVNPTAASTSTCNFLGNRKAGWPLASFSARSATAWAGPPGNPALLGVTGYLSYAKDQAARSMLLFTNNDGFLYAINANTGALMWGWTPRAVLGTLQNYVDLPTRQIMNGNVKLVDSLVNGAWASFVVGSLQSGAEHFSLRLDRAGMPVSVTADAVVSGGLAPEGLPGAVGSVPTHQTPQTLTIQGVSYYTYVITSGGTSTVYEMNVGTGVVSSATLPFVVSSSVYLDQNSSMLWMGSSTGSIYGMVINGNATDDIQRLSKFITVNNPASNSPISKPIINVYSTTLAGTPYLVTNTSDTIAVYTTGTNGWIGKWASTPLSGYSYSSASGAFNSDSSVTPLAASSVISDSIRVDGNTVLVPLDQAAASFCVLDTGYLMLLNLVDGKNNAATYKYGADAASQLLKLGAGPAHTPAITRTIGGLSLNPSTQGCPPGGANCSTNQLTRPEAKTSTSVIGWRNR